VIRSAVLTLTAVLEWKALCPSVCRKPQPIPLRVNVDETMLGRCRPPQYRPPVPQKRPIQKHRRQLSYPSRGYSRAWVGGHRTKRGRRLWTRALDKECVHPPRTRLAERRARTAARRRWHRSALRREVLAHTAGAINVGYEVSSTRYPY